MENGRAEASPRDEVHERNLEHTLKELKGKIQENEVILSKLRTGSPAMNGQHDHTPEAALAIMKTAYQGVADSEPFLPFADSVLPALLALRKAHSTVAESQTYLQTQNVTVKKVKQKLEDEHSNLRDQKLLSSAMKERIESLRNELDARMEMTPEQVAQERLDELKAKKRRYDKDTGALLRVLNKFINDHLASMLAAEDLGGPVVGDMMEIDSDDLAGGFSTQGRPKKTKAGPDEDKRQRRIDELWGPDGLDAQRDRRKWDEAAAAGQEMRSLTERLLNQLMTSGGDSGVSYVAVERESSAARFLVRSKVAQFHPKDATKLRLIDFGRELDD